MAIVTVKSKYQVIIPQAIREKLGISRGGVLEAKGGTRPGICQRLIHCER